MTVHTPTNQKRVQKIVEITELLAVSARSNKATPEDLWKLMEPAINHIQALVAGDTPVEDGTESDSESQPTEIEPVSSEHNPDSVEPVRITIMKLAQSAPLKDLSLALAVYLTRIDEELIYPQKGK